MAAKKFWIKIRNNPQLGICVIACGQLTKQEAKKQENCLYGHNEMLSYETEEQYNDAIKEFKQNGLS